VVLSICGSIVNFNSGEIQIFRQLKAVLAGSFEGGQYLENNNESVKSLVRKGVIEPLTEPKSDMRYGTYHITPKFFLLDVKTEAYNNES
jgi:hypothetical protein